MARRGGRRVLIDASMVQGGGGFTYIVNIVPQLLRLAVDDRFHLLARNPRLVDSLPTHAALEVTSLPPPSTVERLRFAAIEAPRIASRWGSDLYFSVAESVPVRVRCPMIASFRNPNVFERGGWTPRQRMRLELLYGLARLAARRCEAILFVSEDSARWIGDRIGLSPERRTVIHHGLDRESWQGPKGPAPHPRPYILSVSSIYRYKNYVRLIQAYAELARRVDPPDLVIVGDDQDPPYAERMESERRATGALAERIHILGEVPYAQIRSYYAGASLFVFPSYLETFGHPLLEAMASEVPLVAADIPVFREIAGDAALYADPHQPHEIAEAMQQSLTSPGLRERLVALGRERVREFSWSRSAERLLELFDSVIAHST